MRVSRLASALSFALAVTGAAPAIAQTQDWLARCSLELADDAKPESGKYLFLTRGRSAGAAARAELDYDAGISARGATYPTDAKDLLNPFSNVSFDLGYFMPGDGKSKAAVGTVSFRAIGKDFSLIPGSPITMKLVIDGIPFGPYEPKPVSSGMYSVWLDTAETDGDSKPPLLSQVEFGKLANAIDAMKAIEVVLVRDGADLVRAAIPTPQHVAWRDGLAVWAVKTNPGASGAPSCGAGKFLH